jgi:predicted nucleotidyltransferase component of viral defense system
MKDPIASIQDRLLALSRAQGLNHQLTLTRYFQERFLFRLSQSVFREVFLLKGGVLVYAWQGSSTRPTLDIDFLGRNVANDLQTIKGIFQQVAGQSFPADRVVFETNETT